MMARMDDFATRVEAQVSDLGADDSRLAAEEEEVNRRAEDIRRQRAELRGRIADLAHTLDVYRNVMGIQGPRREPEAPQAVSYTVRRGGTIADVVQSILEQRGSPMQVSDLVEALHALGKLHGGGEAGRGDYGTVYRTLTRDRRFEKTGRGEFRLVGASGRPATLGLAIEREQPS